MAFLDENGVAQFWAAVKDRLAGAFNSVEFDVAEQAANLVSGDSIATAFGKLAKNYSSLLTSISDLNTSLGNRISEVNTNLTSQINTKLNKSDVLANYTTTATGKALDASLGPAIKTKMDLADTLNTRVGKIEGRLVLRASATVANPTYHTNVALTSLNIPSNSGQWLLLGNVYHYHYGGNVTELANFTVNKGTPTLLSTIARTTTNNGGGVCVWGYLFDYSEDRIVNLVGYVYDNIPDSTEYRMCGHIMAINLG